MKAIRIHSYGNADLLKLEEAPQPDIKPNEVLVRVRDAGVNPVDWKIREGQFKDTWSPPFPLTMGQDFAGEVLQAGNAVKRFSPGDRVVGFTQGSYAEISVATEKRIVKIPDSISDEIAASLPTAGITAYQAVVKLARASQGKTILIHGAAGGVGSLATQIAVHQGAKVLGTASEKDLPYLRQLGAERAIDYKNERFEDIVKDVDAVIDLVGGETQKRSFSVLKKNGILVTMVGLADTDLPKRLGVNAIELVSDLNATGDLEAVVKLAEQGALKSRLAQIIPLERAKEAQQMSESGNARGKIILKVA